MEDHLKSPFSAGHADEDLRAIPKAHLHVHLAGAVRLETYLEFAEIEGTQPPMPRPSPTDSEIWEIILTASQLIRQPDRLYRVMTELVEDAAKDGAWRIEPSFRLNTLGEEPADAVNGLEVAIAAMEDSARRYGVQAGLVVAANRNRGAREALETARIAARFAGAGVECFGLDGDDRRFHVSEFKASVEVARAAGLLITPHAGEFAGPSTVAETIQHLRPHRIMHGIRAAESAVALHRLADSGASLDVCPTSNALLGIVGSIREHPLRDLLAAGIECSVNADDPLPFSTSLLGEYMVCRYELQLDDRDIAAVAKTSIVRSAAATNWKRAALNALQEWLGRSESPSAKST